MKTRVGVFFGGRSGEHDISLRSARFVCGALDREKYDILPVLIQKDGTWASPARSQKILGMGDDRFLPEAEAELKVGLVGDPAFDGLTAFPNGPGSIEEIGIDVIFPLLHGTFGEDGTIQGLLEMAGIPYIGCGVLASACGMDKVVMKSLFSEAGLPMCKYVWFLRREWEADPVAVANRVAESLGFPCFVKPANLGSSVGISKAVDIESLKDAIGIAAEYDRRIIVEEGLDMREIECGILGNDTADASLPGEYVIKASDKAFLDYEEKYAGTGNNEFVVPAPVSAELASKIREMAKTAFAAIDGSGLARVDFFLRNDNGALLINEINTMPGLTDASGYPKMWAGSGMPFSELLDKLIILARERYDDRARNKTTRVE